MVEKEDDTSPRRATVLDTIARLGETQKIERLAPYFTSPDRTRLDEVFAYLAMMEPVAVKPLFDFLAESEVREVRYTLCRALSIVARHEPDRLRFYLLDKRWYVVRNAVTIMGLIGSANAIPSLGLTSGHPEARVRREVARALGRIKDAAGLAVLADLANDDKEEVRMEAFQAIRKAGSTHAFGFIEECIKDRSFEKRSLEEKKEIFRIYGSTGNQSLKLLRAVISGDIPRLSDNTRAAAVHGVAVVGGMEADGILNALKEGSDGILKNTAIEVLSMADSEQDWQMSDEH
jgi:HEAT repeat protein